MDLLDKCVHRLHSRDYRRHACCVILRFKYGDESRTLLKLSHQLRDPPHVPAHVARRLPQGFPESQRCGIVLPATVLAPHETSDFLSSQKEKSPTGK